MTDMKSLRVMTGHNRTGLFSVVTVLIENLMTNSEKYDYAVELGPEYLYFDLTHGNNVWDYYFNQPSPTLGYGAYSNIEKGFLFDRKGILDVGNRSESYETAIAQAAMIFNTQIGFSKSMSKQLSSIHEELDLERSYVSVHKRETDYLLHSSRIKKCDEFFFEIEKNLGDEKIFLATDSQKVLFEFKLRYGFRLKYLKIPRSLDNTGLHHITKRKYPNWLNGENAVIDAYLLSQGKNLFRTRSNLTTFSRILNPNLKCIEMDYDLQIK
jgi:hypothetical protein